jgi:hypothetical protein
MNRHDPNDFKASGVFALSALEQVALILQGRTDRPDRFCSKVTCCISRTRKGTARVAADYEVYGTYEDCLYSRFVLVGETAA